MPYLILKICGRVVWNALILVAAFIGSCLAAGSVAFTWQIILGVTLGVGPYSESTLDAGVHLALGFVIYGFLIALFTAVPVLIGFLVSRLRSNPPDLRFCVTVGGLYGLFGGLFLESFMHPSDEMLMAATWGAAGVAGGAVFSRIVLGMERLLRAGSST